MHATSRYRRAERAISVSDGTSAANYLLGVRRAELIRDTLRHPAGTRNLVKAGRRCRRELATTKLKRAAVSLVSAQLRAAWSFA